ncbi:MAG: hypothetical protein RMJ98_02430 [Myxococcales bacterium]|nr:hypothetical protein [Polyangiaceae bacterium]MDW8248146.1 hypothetical protein [Myxococcales bacterium]
MTSPPDPPVAFRLRRPYTNEEEFLAHEGEVVSRTGMTLVGAAYRPSGVIVRFEVALWDGTPLFRGEGKVQGHRTAAEGGKLPGLDIRFLRLDARGKSLIDRILRSRQGRPSGEVPDRLATPIPSLLPPASVSLPPASPSSAPVLLAEPTVPAPPVELAPSGASPPSDPSPDTERGGTPEPAPELEPTSLLATPLQPEAQEAPRGLAALRARRVHEVAAPEGRDTLLSRLRAHGMH